MTSPPTLLTHPRVLTVQSAAIPEIFGHSALTPLKLEGSEGINSLFQYQLTLQTPDELAPDLLQGSNIELESLVGRELSCTIELEGAGTFRPGAQGSSGQPNQGAGQRHINSLITQACFLGVDNRHALYQLTLRPWLHLATLTSDCKVFQDQTPVQTIQAVLADYPFSVEWRLIETYPQRDYCVQYNESDFHFVSRLCQEWGINYHFEHQGDVHRLVFSDHNSAFPLFQKDDAHSPYHRIPYYPLGHKTDHEYIHAFVVQDRLTSGSYQSRDYDYTRPKAELHSRHSDPRPTGQNQQDIYLWRSAAGSDYSQPNAGVDKSANQTEPQGQHLARLRMQALRQPGRRASGSAHLRGIVPGCSFSLSGHPQEAANTEYITLQTQLLIENISEDTQRPGQPSGDWRVQVDFEVQPSREALRPALTLGKPHTHGPETALVTGPSAQDAANNIYTDQYGRIKVQFPWDRYGRRNHTSSCWVRVSSPWAGNQLGAMQLPRIGQEVIVDFIGGDPDLPICTGRTYNQLNLPPWSLPGQQALSGFRSRELKPGAGNSAAGRSNHLVLDDSDGQIQAQLKSDHQHSSLSLGHITRIEDHQGRKDERGQGFELRTDGHGAIRAKDGLLISTEARERARGALKDMDETVQRLSQAHEQHETWGQLAQQHQVQDKEDQGQVAQEIKRQNDAVRGTPGAGSSGEDKPFPELAEPHLVLASPAGIESTTSGSTHAHSDGHHAITAGQHTSISAGQSFLVSARQAVRLFAYKAGMKLVAAAGKVQVQAQKDGIEVSALKGIEIVSVNGEVHITGRKKVVFIGGGSFTEWSADGITHGTAGSWQEHAAMHASKGPKSMPVSLPSMPLHEPASQYHTALDAGALLATDPLLANTTYEVWSDTPNPELLTHGLLNSVGRSGWLRTQKSKPVQYLVGEGDWLEVTHIQEVSQDD